MSGFVAIFNQDGQAVDLNLLQLLTDALVFRGPDKQKNLVQGNVGFGHALYRTTHEARFDRQPATLGDKYFITSSARIDARDELFKKLGDNSGRKLEATPDYELILEAYHAWGDDFLDHLIGDFSFVLWDAARQRLICARDQLGVGQLHYAHIDQSFVISNSIYCLLQHPGISRRLNDQAIGDYLLLGDHTWFDKTITAFAEIQTLAPAHTLIISKDKIAVKKYWDFQLNTPLLRYQDTSDYIDHFQQVFTVAVSDRLRYPEVVVAMSGGLDSTATAATIKNNFNNYLNLNVVTALYDSIHPDQERYFSGLVVDQLGLSVHYLDGGQYPMFDIPEPTTRPLGMWQPGFWLKMKKVESDLGRVLISAEAADSTLGFTSLLKMNRNEIKITRILKEIVYLYKKYSRLPHLGSGLVTKLRNIKKQDGINAYPAYPAPTWIDPEFETSMRLKERWETMIQEPAYPLHARHPHIHRSLVDAAWNMDDLCMHSDFTFAEERDPFLDLRLVEFVLSLPPLPWLFNKHLLREAMQGCLPAEIVKRPKTPLGLIHASLIQQKNNQWIDSWEPLPELSKYINRGKIPKLTGIHFKEDISYTHMLPMALNNWLLGLSKIN